MHRLLVTGHRLLSVVLLAPSSSMVSHAIRSALVGRGVRVARRAEWDPLVYGVCRDGARRGRLLIELGGPAAVLADWTVACDQGGALDVALVLPDGEIPAGVSHQSCA